MPVIAAIGKLERLGGVEHLFLVFLHILRIGQRQTLHHRQKCDQVAVDAAGLGADQFGRVGFFFCGMIDEPVENASESGQIRIGASTR
jgi:uncharacterized membrane protein YjdF